MDLYLKGFVKATLIGKLTVVGAFLSVTSTASYGAELALSELPMAVNAAVEPNIMLMFDTSGSMANIVPEEGDYNPSVDYCERPGAIVTVGTGFAVIVPRDRPGTAQFFYEGQWRTWGRGDGEYCFEEDGRYSSFLRDRDRVRVPGGAGVSTYSGNYLNWYFSNAGSSDAPGTGPAQDFVYGDKEGRKRGTRTRLDVAKSAITNWTENLSNVRLGLTSFAFDDPTKTSGSDLSKGKIHLGLASLDSSYKDEVLDSIDRLPIDGNTPLATTFANIGRYFLEGNGENSLALNKDRIWGAANNTYTGYEVFNKEPIYADVDLNNDGVSDMKPTSANPAIESACQKSFLMALTDGLPSADDDYPTDYYDLGNYITRANPWESLSKALYDIDFRPDLIKPDGQKNNITSYIIGFGGAFASGSALAQRVATAGGGGDLLTATDETKLKEALDKATSSILDQVGSTASVAFNTSTLKANSAIYQAKFNSAKWSGQLLSFAIDDYGNVDAQERWDAAEKIPTNRTILTYDGTHGQAFQWNNIKDDRRGDDLNQNDYTGVADGEGSDRVDYLRGGDDAGFRERDGKLGDIVNSTPVYVGKPELKWPDAEPFGETGSFYSKFKAEKSNRTPVLYVGANDGMLHGFNAELKTDEAGTELLSYVPSQVYSSERYDGLHALTDGGYGHRFYVDLTPTVSDIYINKGQGDKWMSILVGGLRKGGKGYFALDVTDPIGFSEANARETVLWEFDEFDEPEDDRGDLGYSYSRPVVAMMANGEWAVIFGNGYNSTRGNAVLYILFVEKGLDGTWTATSDFKKIDTGEGRGEETDTPNGLSSPAVVDLDFDGIADRIYAGDLKGNMWAFDVTDTNGVWEDKATLIFEPLPGQQQPITVEPIIALNSETTAAGNAPNTMVLFGTGSYLTNGDIVDETAGSFYGVWDHGVSTITPSDLVERTFIQEDVDEKTLRKAQDGIAIDWASKHGWYVNLQEGDVSDNRGGERVVSEALLRRNVLLFNTTIPISEQCRAGGGGWLMSVDFATGLPPKKAVFDADGNGLINNLDLDYIGEQMTDGLLAKSGVLGKYQYTPQSDGSLLKREIDVGGTAREGSLGWQEITPK